MNRTPDGLVKAGAIINIICGALICLTIIGAAIGIPAIITNKKVLNGTATDRTAAGVLGIFVSTIGGILVLVGKYE